MYKEASRFLRLLAVYLIIYAWTLYTWKKPMLMPNLDYLKDYKLESAPIWSLDEALYINRLSCPPENVNFHRDAVAEHEKRWSEVTTENIYLWRDAMQKHLRSAKHIGATSGRGIVMSAGNHAAMSRAGVSLSLLRSYGCELPVQIYHYTDEADMISSHMIEMLKNLGAEVIELSGVDRGSEWKAYHIKAMAIQRCSFDEVMYLDTDTYLLRDPTYLFESKQFKDTGAMLWPDFTKSHPTNPVWRLLGIPCRPEFEGESGQLMFNRFMHQEAMHLAEFFAMNRDPYYTFMGGDRDSFRIALLALGKTWSGPARMVASAGIDREVNAGHTMMQADHDGKWLFVHANLLKHSAIPEGTTWAILDRVREDTFEGGYGVLKGNENVGDGVIVQVSPLPDMFATMKTTVEVSEKWTRQFIVRENFTEVKELKDFEASFYRYGGKKLSL